MANKYYYILYKDDLIELCDDVKRGSVNPRRWDNLEQYVMTGRHWVLQPRHMILWFLLGFTLGMVVFVAIATGGLW